MNMKNLLSVTESSNDVTTDQIITNMAKNGVDVKEWDFMYDLSKSESIISAFLGYFGDNYRDAKQDGRFKEIFENTDSDVKIAKTKLYRGQSIDEATVKNYKVGQLIQERGVSSWTTDYMIANRFAKVNQSPVIYVERSNGVKNAISMKNISNLNEYEVMYAPDQKFKIQSISKASLTNQYGITKEVTVLEVSEINQ